MANYEYILFLFILSILFYIHQRGCHISMESDIAQEDNTVHFLTSLAIGEQAVTVRLTKRI